MLTDAGAQCFGSVVGNLAVAGWPTLTSGDSDGVHLAVGQDDAALGL